MASPNMNPGLERLARAAARLDPTDAPKRRGVRAARQRAEAAVIGPEAALARGVADALRAAEIPTVGPDRAAASIESSKGFCRELLARSTACQASPVHRAGHASRRWTGRSRSSTAAVGRQAERAHRGQGRLGAGVRLR